MSENDAAQAARISWAIVMESRLLAKVFFRERREFKMRPGGEVFAEITEDELVSLLAQAINIGRSLERGWK